MGGHNDGPVVHPCECTLLGKPSQGCAIEQEVCPRNDDELRHFAVSQQLKPLGCHPLHERQIHNQILGKLHGKQPFREMKHPIRCLISKRVAHVGNLRTTAA